MQRLVCQIDLFCFVYSAKNYCDSGAQTFHYIGTKKYFQLYIVALVLYFQTESLELPQCYLESILCSI